MENKLLVFLRMGNGHIDQLLGHMKATAFQNLSEFNECSITSKHSPTNLQFLSCRLLQYQKEDLTLLLCLGESIDG